MTLARSFVHWLRLALLAAFVLSAMPNVALAQDRGRLVSTEWLAQNLESAELLLIDASPPPLHAAGHIPGAVNVNVFSLGPRRADAAAMEQRLQAWGVSPGRKIVVYDPGASYLATYVFFELLLHGVPAADLHVLDGGLAKWRAAGGAVTKEPSAAPARGSFKLTTLDESVRVRLPEFLTGTGDPKNHALIDALEPSSYYGETAFFDRAGHMPHALMWPSEDLFNADKTFKSREELERMAAHLGIRREQEVYTYCGGGIAASAPFFALKFIAGYPKVRLFQESQLGWVRDPRGLPLWTYAEPNLLRETAWLKFWASKIARSYGVSEVSIVDVRSPEAYAQGHLPFALNVPAATFKAHFDDPARLAALLGEAGVSRAHEAVIVSDNGLDDAAALAWLTLERLGQKKVSLFTDNLMRWAELGQEVTREPTLVGERKTPADLVVPRVSYVPEVQRELVVADPLRTRGVFPKVYLYTGKGADQDQARRKLPADAKVVHVPHTAFADAVGRPKAAKDLWNQLSKAGVPRYAEIIVFGADAGEAAVGFFVLRLMGFADVKVWRV
jgi:thiosulfate/3-mercaptopyruvate sulfurtransferase